MNFMLYVSTGFFFVISTPGFLHFSISLAIFLSKSHTHEDIAKLGVRPLPIYLPDLHAMLADKTIWPLQFLHAKEVEKATSLSSNSIRRQNKGYPVGQSCHPTYKAQQHPDTPQSYVPEEAWSFCFRANHVPVEKDGRD